ncbi:MAG: hypothetical protein HDQ88_02355 [Clostridia bacterium]|nr:hypothetical protein [Clostridia bacterium]
MKNINLTENQTVYFVNPSHSTEPVREGKFRGDFGDIDNKMETIRLWDVHDGSYKNVPFGSVFETEEEARKDYVDYFKNVVDVNEKHGDILFEDINHYNGGIVANRMESIFATHISQGLYVHFWFGWGSWSCKPFSKETTVLPTFKIFVKYDEEKDGINHGIEVVTGKGKSYICKNGSHVRLEGTKGKLTIEAPWTGKPNGKGNLVLVFELRKESQPVKL